MRLRPFPWIQIAFVAALTLLLSGWTCFVGFESCQGIPQQPQIALLSPGTISADADSVPLIVEGNGFVPQSQILWNGNSLVTTFIDVQHLQTTITQQTFESFGGSLGNNVKISVRNQESGGGTICQNDVTSATMILVID